MDPDEWFALNHHNLDDKPVALDSHWTCDRIARLETIFGGGLTFGQDLSICWLHQSLMGDAMRHEFRFDLQDASGRCYLSAPCAADYEVSITDGLPDIEISAVSLNGAMISGPLLEAVTDYMIEQGIIDAMRRLSKPAA